MKTDIKLDANVFTGEGEIKIMPHFEKMNTLWQLDVLKDWIYDLDNEYSKRMCVWRDEGKAIRKKGIIERKKRGIEPEVLNAFHKHKFCTSEACQVHDLKGQNEN